MLVCSELDHATCIAAATSYVEVSKGNKLAVGYTSVSIALNCDVHWHPHLPNPPAVEAHQAVEEDD